VCFYLQFSLIIRTGHLGMEVLVEVGPNHGVAVDHDAVLLQQEVDVRPKSAHVNTELIYRHTLFPSVPTSP
jgi:hypothetical protein